MRYLLAVAALPMCVHNAQTAKIALSALYTAEKAYYAENESYNQNLLEIGADPSDQSCDSRYWSLKAYVRRSGEAFTGISTSLITGETWVINEKKQLKQVRKPSKELPKAHVQEMPRDAGG